MILTPGGDLMISIVVIASLMVGVLAGLWIKPTHLEFCSTCGTCRR